MDNCIGVHSNEQFGGGNAEPSTKESESQGLGGMVEESSKDYPDDHFHSIYSDISECVLSDPQVVIFSSDMQNCPAYIVLRDKN